MKKGMNIINAMNALTLAVVDTRDLLQKRYLEFLPWTEIMTEMGYSRSHVFRLNNKSVEAIKSWDFMGLENT